MKEKIRDFKDALERVSSGISELEVAQLPSGDTVRLLHDPRSQGGYRVETRGEGVDTPVLHRPDPATKKRIDEIQELTRRILSGESDAEEITLPTGGTVRLTGTRGPAGDVTVGGSGNGLTFRTVAFDESDIRPPGYPHDIPFLPACPASLMDKGADGPRTMSWSRVLNPKRLFKTLREQLEADGWTCHRDTLGAVGVTQTAVMSFRKGETDRMFLLTGSSGQFHMKMREYRRWPDEASGSSEPQVAG